MFFSQFKKKNSPFFTQFRFPFFWTTTSRERTVWLAKLEISPNKVEDMGFPIVYKQKKSMLRHSSSTMPKLSYRISSIALSFWVALIVDSHWFDLNCSDLGLAERLSSSWEQNLASKLPIFNSTYVTVFYSKMRYGSPDSGVLQIIWSFRESSREETEGHARLEGKTMFFNYNFYTLTSRLSTCKVYGILFRLLAFI